MAVGLPHNQLQTMMSFPGTSSFPRTSGTRSFSSRGRGPAPNQMVLDFDQPVELAPDAKLPAPPCPVAEFARRVATLLETEPAANFDNVAISRLAQEVFGCSAGYARDAYDAAETGLNIYLHRIGLDLANIPTTIERLLAVQARLPVQTRRDQTQLEFQQFSTPPAAAFLVVKETAICHGM